MTLVTNFSGAILYSGEKFEKVTQTFAYMYVSTKFQETLTHLTHFILKN